MGSGPPSSTLCHCRVAVPACCHFLTPLQFWSLRPRCPEWPICPPAPPLGPEQGTAGHALPEEKLRRGQKVTAITPHDPARAAPLTCASPSHPGNTADSSLKTEDSVTGFPGTVSSHHGTGGMGGFKQLALNGAWLLFSLVLVMWVFPTPF